MEGLRSPNVSIVKCNEHDNYQSIKTAVKRCLDLLGGLEAIVSLGDRVLLKPNILAPKPYTTGATTNPYIVKALVELSKEAGAKEVIIGEGSAVGHDTFEGFEFCGIKQIAEEYNCRLVDLAKDEFEYVINPMAKIFKRIRVPKTFIEVNVVINIPVMKTHDALGVTLGLKNMKGIIHISDKKRFHKWGLAQSVVDLNHIALPELTVMDGTIAMEGNGPVSGNPVGLGLIMASTDTVACDAVACKIMGFEPEEIDYIKFAQEQGLGCCDISKIKVLGERLSDVVRPFKRISLNHEKLKELGINLISCDACSGCNHVVMSYLVGLEEKGKLQELSGYTIVYGQSAYIPEEVKDKVIKLGVCTRNLTGAEGIYIPGCPPHPHHINEKIE
jgi:uncharacterized protein (DUF362 family)